MKGVFLTMQASSRTHRATTGSPNVFGPSTAWKQFSFEKASPLATPRSFTMKTALPECCEDAKTPAPAGSTSHSLSPETEAELDRVLFTPNLPLTPPFPIPDPQAVLAALSLPPTPASSTPFAQAEVAKALQDLTADNLQELLSILTAPQAPSPLMDSLELSPGSASQLLLPVPQTPLSTQTALSLESHFLEDWLLDPESLSPAQAQVQGPFMEVPCSQPRNPVGPSHLTPHSQVTSLHSCLYLFTCALLSVYCSTHKRFCEVL